MKAGVSEQDVTPPVGLPITHPVRPCVGMHDPLFVRALALQDKTGTTVAIVRSDLCGCTMAASDELRARLRSELGLEHVILNFAHPHSSRGLGGYGHSPKESPAEAAWGRATFKAFISVTAEALKRLEPVSLRAGRAPAQVGFNRRVPGKNGHVYMDVNRDGAVVPWVNVLVADRQESGRTASGATPMAVLFEHAAHPVIVPDEPGMISADFPGAATARIREKLGPAVMPLFGQGCQGNINGYPLRTTQENADEAGRKLGDAVVGAIDDCAPIKADRLLVRRGRTELPLCKLPPIEEIIAEIARFKAELERTPNRWWPQESLDDLVRHGNNLQALLARGEQPPHWQMEATVVMLGDEWCLAALQHKVFCEYELWVAEHAPFKHSMTFACTNGLGGYIATDEALAMGPKGGYEAAGFPNLGGCDTMTPHFGPPGVGAEQAIKQLLSSLWSKE